MGTREQWLRQFRHDYRRVARRNPGRGEWVDLEKRALKFAEQGQAPEHVAKFLGAKKNPPSGWHQRTLHKYQRELAEALPGETGFATGRVSAERAARGFYEGGGVDRNPGAAYHQGKALDYHLQARHLDHDGHYSAGAEAMAVAESERENWLESKGRRRRNPLMMIMENPGIGPGLRYTVVKSGERRGGYKIRDSQPRFQEGIDVEGVGWWQWPQPRRLPETFGWFKHREDAEHRAEVLNQASLRNPSPAWHEGKMREHGKAYSQRMNQGAYETAEYERGHRDAHTESYKVGMRGQRNPGLMYRANLGRRHQQFPPSPGSSMIASGTYPTGVNMAPFWYVEEIARKGKFALLAYGAYNAFGLIGPEKGGVALVDEEAYQVIGTKDVPYNPRGRHELLLRVESSPDWVNAAASAGFDMRFSHYTNPGRHRNPLRQGLDYRLRPDGWGEKVGGGAVGRCRYCGVVGPQGDFPGEGKIVPDAHGTPVCDACALRARATGVRRNPEELSPATQNWKKEVSLLIQELSRQKLSPAARAYVDAAWQAWAEYGVEGLAVQLLYIYGNLRGNTPEMKRLKAETMRLSKYRGN